MNYRTCSSETLCFLAGGLIGAGVALLLAPQSGEATREDVRRNLRGAADSVRGLKDRAVRLGDEGRDQARRVGAAVSDATGRVAETAARVAERLSDVARATEEFRPV